ncbi:MAG: LuxR family transcriptional regulator [Candidatus Nitrotoga sp.]|jgi:DNA-binding CsgD family transcriptional regulator|nr:LuxR family transcriptional regulator [Candidatus Nitrotoga sp.]MDO9446697.1 LuxR family transcriptional regulator [Candidatus Nitrotoga sp.]MDP1637844.1 LuxR family transcriptional regulator [Candidatus Nitrotoga sp.]MDP1855042.1 LuxR family transcriptional regulator [Candidatus Nitrotoga sp.]MDP3497147.1 LuxR family transcriptional regulator [Candidatus Nitrotoga sp.]
MSDLDLFESLLSCGTVEALHATTASIAGQLGFDHFIYGVQVNTSLTRPYQFILNGYPKEWRAHYVEHNYQEIDPTYHHCITKRQTIPVIWDSRVFKGSKEAKMRNESREFGLLCGASFAVHGGHGEAAMLSLASSQDSYRAQQDILSLIGKSQLLACYLHEAVQRIVLSKGPLLLTKMELTLREKECLLWAAEGKTGGEIADILQITERTVTFHLQNAGNKMGASNRQHAIARALSMGLIAP